MGQPSFPSLAKDRLKGRNHFPLNVDKNTGIGGLCVCHQDTAAASQGDLREAPGRPITVLGKGPPLCSEPGTQQGGRLVRRTHSGAMWAEIHPLSSLSCVLETLTSAFEHKQLMAYVCVCAGHTYMALQGTTQQPQSPFPCDSSLFTWEECAGAGTTSGLQASGAVCSSFCVGSTVMAVPSPRLTRVSHGPPSVPLQYLSTAVFHSALSCFPFF